MATAMFSQCVQETVCPKKTCFAQVGQMCQTPKRRKTWPPHKERIHAYLAKIGLKEVKRRHSMQLTSGADIVKRLTGQV